MMTSVGSGVGVSVTVAVGSGVGVTVSLRTFDVMPLDAWLVTHADLRALPRVRATIDALAESFRAYAMSDRSPGSETPAGPGAEPRTEPSAGNQLP